MRKKGVVSKRPRLGEQREWPIYFYKDGEHAGQLRTASYLPWSAKSQQEKGNGFLREGMQSTFCPPHCVHPATAGTLHPATHRSQAPQ